VATAEEIADEAKRARKVRQIVDISASLIMQGGLTRDEAERLVHIARDQVLALFPDGAETFEIVYTQRFQRLIDEFAVRAISGRATVLPFRPFPH
jgi:hypothetical protein